MKTLWTFKELAPYVFDPKQISGDLEVKDELLERSPLIEDVNNVHFDGMIIKDSEQEVYVLTGEVIGDLVLKSTRSLNPVDKVVKATLTESYLAPEDVDVVETFEEDDVYFVSEKNQIDIAESVVENLILSIPIRILTEKEETSGYMPEGDDWKVISEEEYAKEQQKNQEENSPFNALYSLFDEDDEQAND